MTGDHVTFEEAEGRLRRRIAACEDRTGREALTVELVALYSRALRHEQGKNLLRTLIDEAANDEDAARFLLHLGQLCEQTGDFDQAHAVYARAIGLKPRTPWVQYLLCNNSAYLLNRKGEHVRAETLCRMALKIDGERHNAYKNLGVALEGQGRYAPAAALYLLATERNPADRRAFDLLTDLLARHDDARREVPEFEEWLADCRALIEAAHGKG